ncbi:hypothetical protein Vafri_13565 [Volvox africanus]|nr:hypothetical protein Vafri_13565 [Volvox africanus]
MRRNAPCKAPSARPSRPWQTTTCAQSSSRSLAAMSTIESLHTFSESSPPAASTAPAAAAAPVDCTTRLTADRTGDTVGCRGGADRTEDSELEDACVSSAVRARRRTPASAAEH